MTFRQYIPSDCAALAALFYQTVHHVNAKDYTQEQLDAWATGHVDMEKWNSLFIEHYTIVAVNGNLIVGFGDIDESGYLDKLYVHKDYQRQGIAKKICDLLEEKATSKKIVTHASITAKSFFERRGYTVVRQQEVIRYDVSLTNYVMEKAPI